MVQAVDFSTSVLSRGGVKEPIAFSFDNATDAFEKIFHEISKDSKVRKTLVNSAISAAKEAHFDIESGTKIRITSLKGAVLEQESGRIYPMGIRTLALEVTQEDENGSSKTFYVGMDGKKIQTFDLKKLSLKEEAKESSSKLSIGKLFNLLHDDMSSKSLSPEALEAQLIIQRMQQTQDALKLYREGYSFGLERLIDQFIA